MPPLSKNLFLVVSILLCFIRDDFALEEEYTSKTWHSYVFNSGAGNREGIKLVNFDISNFGSVNYIKKWQVLQDQYSTLILGLGNNFLYLTSLSEGSEPGLVQTDLKANLSSIVAFQRWNSSTQYAENFAIVSGCETESRCFLNLYQVSDRKLIYYWNWPFNKHIVHIEVLNYNYELKLLVVSYVPNQGHTSAEIYSFSMDNILDFWLYDRFILDDCPSDIHMSLCNDNIYLSFVFPKLEMLYIYKTDKSSRGHNHFKIHHKISCKKDTSLTTFYCGFHCYLAIASSNSSIYVLNGKGKLIYIEKNFGSLKNWFAIPLNTLQESVMLMAEGENETALILWSGSKQSLLSNNQIHMACRTEHRCIEELRGFAAKGAATFFFNGYYSVVYTSTSGKAKMCNFSVITEVLPDIVDSELSEIYKSKALIEELWKEQEQKSAKLDKAVRKISNGFNMSSKISWKLKHLKVNIVTVSQEHNATINVFEYAHNKKWIENDYAIYLDLPIELQSEILLSEKINQIDDLFHKFSNAAPIEITSLTGLVVDDVSFLGSVTVNQLQLSYLNGIEVNDMLQNSLMLSSHRKIGGIKTVTNINVDHIMFEKLSDIKAQDIIFSDELMEKEQGNVINGTIVFENDVKILEKLELLSREEDVLSLSPYIISNGFSFMDEIAFDHLVIMEESLVEETFNGRPLILAVHSSPFDVFSSDSVHQVRVEDMNVKNNLKVRLINGVDFIQLLRGFEKNFTSCLDRYISRKDDLSTSNLHISYLNNVKFPEGFIALNLERTANLSHKNFINGLIVHDLNLRDRSEGNYLRSISDSVNVATYDNIAVHLSLKAKMINNYSWQQLRDILKKQEHGKMENGKIHINGTKHLRKCRILENLTVIGKVNAHDVNNIMTKYSEQALPQQSFSDIIFDRLNVSGFFDGMDIESIKQSTVRLSHSENYESDLIFQNELIPWFSAIVILGSLNNISKPNELGDQELVIHKNLSFKALSATQLTVNGSLLTNDQVNNVNLTQFNLKRMSVSHDQVVQRNLNHHNIAVHNLDVIVNRTHETHDALYTVNLSTIKTFLNADLLHSVKSIVVKGNVRTQKGINGFNLAEMEKDIACINSTGILTRKILFNELVTFNNLKINGHLQGINLKRLHQDLIYDSSYVSIKGTKTFVGNFTVMDKMKVRSLNGHLIQRIMTKKGDHLLTGSVTVSGNVRVAGNVTSYGSINGFPISDVLKKYSAKHSSYVLGNDVTLKVSEIDSLSVEGLIKDKFFATLMDDLVKVNQSSCVAAKKIILGSVNFSKNISVEKTINGLNITDFSKDIVFINKETVLEGDLILGKAIIQSLAVKKDFNSTLLHGFDIGEWLEESIPLNEGAGISGKKLFKNPYCLDDIVTDYVNDYLMASAIALNKEQFIPCSVHFPIMKSLSDISVGRWVNGKILGEEFADTVWVDEDQEISGIFIFLKKLTLEGNMTLGVTKGKNLRHVTTLDTDQTISSLVVFENMTVGASIDNLELINGINIRKWNQKSVSLNKNQTITGSWTVEGNLTIYNRVEGRGLIGSRSISDVRRSIAKMKMLTSDIRHRLMSDFEKYHKRLCTFSNKLSLQPSLFHHFEVSQILKTSLSIESVIPFQANNNDYLMLTFFNECLSILYQWSRVVSKFSYVNHMNIGPVSKWITIYFNNATYLITSSISDIVCEENSRKGNVWIFNDSQDKYGHLFTTGGFLDIVKSIGVHGKYYTLEKNGDIFEWTLGSGISSHFVTNLGGDEFEFLDLRVIGELAVSNGRQIMNSRNELVHVFPKSHHSRIVVTVIKGKTLVVVPYHDEIVIYENLLEQKIYASVPALKVGSVLWLDSGSDHPYLLCESHASIEIIDFKGAHGAFKKFAIPISSQKLLLISMLSEEGLRPRQFVLVVQKKKVLLLESCLSGNLYQGEEYLCV